MRNGPQVDDICSATRAETGWGCRNRAAIEPDLATLSAVLVGCKRENEGEPHENDYI